MVFDNVYLPDVVDQLIRYYKRQIILQDEKLKAKKITLTFDNQAIEDVLEEIGLLINIDYKYKNDTIFISISDL